MATTQAYFENIQSQIILELEDAKNSIKIAVAWFTDIEILKVLEKKQMQNVNIELVLSNDEINTGIFGLDYSTLEKCGGKVYFVGGSNNETLMHNKFCIIDNMTIISGSYNWSKKARRNHENITVIKNSVDLSNQFVVEFHTILKAYNKPINDVVEKVDMAIIMKRLEAIKALIQLEDEDALTFQISKLIKESYRKSGFIYQTEIDRVVNLLKNNLFGQALETINDLTKELGSVVLYQDPEIPALKLEMRALEFQIVALDNEKLEIKKTLHKFNSKHDDVLGVLILEILRLNKEILRHEKVRNPIMQDAFDAAEKEYKNFGSEQSVKRRQNEISEEQLIEIKSKYRKAAILCHPDKVGEQHKLLAQSVFNKLSGAYNDNDLNGVSEILSFLEKNNWEIKDTERPSESNQLKVSIISLRLKVGDLLSELNSIKNSETYLTVVSISDNWDNYFSVRKEVLQIKIDKLTQKLQEYEQSEFSNTVSSTDRQDK
jgi:ribosomal protein L20A (L18A)